MASQSPQIKYCIFCSKKNLKESPKKNFCIACRGSFKFSISKEMTPADLEKAYKKDMVCCYNCGEDLVRTEGRIMCVDGCDMIDINEDENIVDEPKTKKDDNPLVIVEDHKPELKKQHSKDKTSSGWVKNIAKSISDAGRIVQKEAQLFMTQDMQRQANKALEKLLRGAWKNQRELKILVTGKTGQGKSTLINGILGACVATEGARATRCTTEVQMYSKTIKGVPIKVFDSPGLQDRTANEEEYIQGMRDTCQELSLIIYATKMINTRLTDDDKNAMLKLTKAFGENFWNYAVFVLTFANLEDVTRKDDRDKDEPEPDINDGEAWKALGIRRFQGRLRIWEDDLQNFLITEVGVNSAIAKSIPVVPAGDHNKTFNNKHPLCLPDRDNWFNKYWEACCLRVKETSLFLQVNSDRMVTDYDTDESSGYDSDEEEEIPDEEEMPDENETLTPEKEKEESQKDLQSVSAITEKLEQQMIQENEYHSVKKRRETSSRPMPKHRDIPIIVTNRHSAYDAKSPPIPPPKPLRTKKTEEDYGLPRIPMDALQPPIHKTHTRKFKSEPDLSKSEPEQGKEKPLLEQNIHIDDELARNIAMESVKKNMGESAAATVQTAMKYIAKPGKWLIGLFGRKK